jgi:gliding motility-associated-like protein
MSANASFYYFVSSTNGPLNINITPTDVLGVPYPNLLNSPDLDYKCWGPFSDLSTMCDQLTNANQEDCSTAPPTTAEVMQIGNAVAGQIYVVMVANWAATGTVPDPCFIEFTAAGPFDAFGGPNPGDAGGSVGIPNPIVFCDTDPALNLIDILNGSPLNWGYWTFAGDTATGTFNPASDTGGTYTYTIPGTQNCPSDIAYAVVDIFSASSISITSPLVICSNESQFTLTGIPPAGWSALGEGIFTNSTGTIITDFDPATYGVGNHNFTYTYTPIGCNPIPIVSSILVNEAPTVLATNTSVNNPSCYGYSDGNVIMTASGGSSPYNYNWFGEDPLQLSAGTYNYTIIDANGCSYSSSVSLYNPLNTSSSLIEYNSSCYGANDGAAALDFFSGTTPPGTISLLSYCASNPAPNFQSQAATTIDEVQLIGDNFNIQNNTTGIDDFYEDYTINTGLPGEFADLSEAQMYTVNITPNDYFATTGSYAPQAINVYIDFNIDGDFNDAGEDLGVINIAWGAWVPGTVYPFNFIVPITGAYGASRMRVVCMSNGGGAPITMDDCQGATNFDTPWFGATEDYSIVLNAPSSSATFLWDNGSTADSISNLGPGTYNVIITVAGCPFQDFAVINEPSEIIFNPTITDISCNSFNDGVITLSASGGNGGPYTQNWLGQNSAALSAGSYNVIISDPTTITTTNLLACENDTIIVMIEPAYFSVAFTISDNEICLNDPVTLDFNFNQGGIAPYTINYTVNALAQVIGPINSTGTNSTSLSPLVGNNTYIINSITDANGCINQNTISVQNIYVNALPDIDFTVLPNPICYGDDATLLFTTPTGTPPYNLDYTNGGIASSVNIPSGGLPLLVSPTVTTTYSLTYVTDSKGCESNLSDNSTIVVNEIPQVNFSSQNETCDGDIIQLRFNFTAGVAPWFVNYSVNGVSTAIPFSNSSDSISISPATASVYEINSITDNNNCKNNIAQTLSIITNPLPEIVLSGGGSICNDGSTTNIIFTTNSGTPPYSLNYSAGLIPNSVSNIGNIYSVTSNQSGIYTIQDLTDTKGCEAISISGSAFININPIPEATISVYPQSTNIINPQIHFIDLSNDHTNGIWNFDDGTSSTTNFNELIHNYSDTGTYQVSLTIESDSGCTDIASQTIYISPAFNIYVPNAFTPNNDLDNDYFLPIVDGVSEYEFSVYDRRGERIFSTNKTNIGWKGKRNNAGEFAPAGIYVYSILLTDFNGKLRTFEGTVMLIR